MVPGACQTKLPAKIVHTTRLGVDSGRVGALLGVSWPAFARSWAAPGLSWVLLGCVVGRSSLSIGCAVELQGRILAPRNDPGFDFKGFGAVPD